MVGSALSIGDKKALPGGTESLPEDFRSEKMFVTEDTAQGVKKIKKSDRLIITGAEQSSQLKDNTMNMDATGASEKLETYFAHKNNRNKYNNYLRDARIKRIESAKNFELKNQLEGKEGELEDKIPDFFKNHDYDNEEKKIIHPLDKEFWYGSALD